jgi:G patch domain-containing protein 1
MDEEDIADQEDARRVETAEAFAGLGSTQDDSVRRGGFVDLFQVEGETMGTKLLKKMGWKEGQGVGPKVRRKARLEGLQKAGDNGEMHLFAPENTRMISFVRKTDSKGLGYAGEEKLMQTNDKSEEVQLSDDEDDRSAPVSLFKKAKKKPPARGGIGY